MRRRDGWLMASKAPKGGWMGGHHMERKGKKKWREKRRDGRELGRQLRLGHVVASFLPHPNAD